MKKLITYAIVIASAVLLWGCPNTNDEIQQRINDFCLEEAYGIYNGDQMLFEFNPANCQIVFSAADGTSRLQKDDQTSYVHYKITGSVVDNGTVTVSVAAKGAFSPIKETTMTVKKIDGNKVWLWQADKQYGHLIYWEF